MKSCLNCGLTAPDDAELCIACGRDFAYRGEAGPADGSPFSPDAASPRPTGQLPLLIGWGAIAIGLLLLFSSFFIDVRPYGYTLDPTRVAMRWNLALSGSGLTGIGSLLWATGYIVKAISFLPGKPDAQD